MEFSSDRVKEIGADLKESADVKVGDKIATLVSLSLTPLKIYEITDIDVDTEQVYCKADAVLFETGIYTKLPEDLGDKLSLAADGCGGGARTGRHSCQGGRYRGRHGRGQGGLLCLAEAQEARVSHGEGRVSGVFRRAVRGGCAALGIADVVLQVNGQKPLETYEAYTRALNGKLSDFTVSTVSVSDTELSTHLVTDDNGMIYFLA